MKKITFSLVALLALLSACGNTDGESSSEDNQDEEVAEESEYVHPTPENINHDEYWTSLEYDDFARYPEENTGQKTNIVGRVVQVINGVEDEFTMFLHSQNVSNDQSFFYIQTELLGERILEGDEVRFFAIGSGEYTYETVQGASRTIPLFYIHDYEIYQ